MQANLLSTTTQALKSTSSGVVLWNGIYFQILELYTPKTLGLLEY